MAAKARIPVDVRRLDWIRALAGEYAFNFARVSELYAGDPSSPATWRDAIARAHELATPRREIAAIVAAQQERRDAPPEARAAAGKLAAPRSVAIVTGQQAGAFGGPLFTLLKAITAIQLARRTAREHQTDAVPVFWVDAEDHDWNEVASCTVLDGNFQPRTVTIPSPPGAGDLPVAALTLDERIDQPLTELSSALAATEFTEWTLEILRQAYRPGVKMGDAFARWLEAVLGRFGLVVFESSDPAAKPLVAGVFTRELRSAGRTAALAAEAGEQLARRGHEPQVVPQPDSVSLFHLEKGRQAIRRHQDRYAIGDTTRPAEAVLSEAAASPSLFSPNVLLRPIVQDTLFPTICYVPGPSELAYLGQLKGVYTEFGVPMPLMYPRATATLVDSATARFLDRHDVRIEDLQRQDESVLNRLLESQLPQSVDRAMNEAVAAIRDSMQRLIAVMPELDATLAGAAKSTLGKMEHELKTLQSKMIHAAKRRDETLRRQFTRAQAQVFPLGHPQERTLGSVYFLNRYGPALIDRLLEELPLDLGYHWVMTV